MYSDSYFSRLIVIMSLPFQVVYNPWPVKEAACCASVLSLAPAPAPGPVPLWLHRACSELAAAPSTGTSSAMLRCSPTSTRQVTNGLCLEVEGKMVSRTEGNIDDSLTGGNASAEGPEEEGTESTEITGVDIVMNHHLQETSYTKEAYKKYIKDYMKS